MKEKLRKNKFLRNKKSFIFLLILCLGVGFAFLSTQLTITGNTSVSGNKWSVYFNNVQVTEGSVEASVVPTTTGTTTTSLDYTVLLDKPGDFYEFTVDAVNAGTIDAMVETINMTNLDANVSKYLSYTATYEYGTIIKPKDVLQKNSTATYKVRVEYQKDIESTDLSEERINLTLNFGVNYVQSTVVSEFVKLVGRSSLSDTSLDFTQISSQSNGEGLYVMNSTKNNSYPIYYYRGNVSNNNAKFGGYCWKIVRTTETGGTKLIYNGEVHNTYNNYTTLNENDYVNIINDDSYPYTYDSSTNNWTNNQGEEYTSVNLSFSLSEVGDYILNYSFPSEDAWSYVSIEKDGESISSFSSSDERSGSISINNVYPSTVITVSLMNEHVSSNNTDSIISFNMQKGTNIISSVCDATGEKTQITRARFGPNNSLAYFGYMSGIAYGNNSRETNTSHVYGNTFTYENGTYTLSDTHAGLDDTHHYTCFNESGVCSTLFYLYSTSVSNRYIELSNGESIEDALENMYSNKTNSGVKNSVDTWFNNAFNKYFTQNNKDYNDYLEDTIWCNDRSMNTIADITLDSWLGTSAVNNGWKPNGGSTANSLVYGSYGRIKAGTPSLVCSNKNDSFTVNESSIGNGTLDYPVGLLTADEAMLAGGQTTGNTSYYLYGSSFWTMSPNNFFSNYAYGTIVDYDGSLNRSYVSNGFGIRPTISIKPEVKIAAGGTGTAANPYEFIVE